MKDEANWSLWGLWSWSSFPGDPTCQLWLLPQLRKGCLQGSIYFLRVIGLGTRTSFQVFSLEVGKCIASLNQIKSGFELSLPLVLWFHTFCPGPQSHCTPRTADIQLGLKSSVSFCTQKCSESLWHLLPVRSHCLSLSPTLRSQWWSPTYSSGGYTGWTFMWAMCYSSCCIFYTWMISCPYTVY